jgi:3-phosphoshikimate 1-carboxyvinyltransferase
VSHRSIQLAGGPLSRTFRAVASKSVTHRAAIAAALASGPSALIGALDSDDTRATFEGLSALGFETRRVDGRWEIEGRGGTVPGGGNLWLAESGTSLRFLTAVAGIGVRPSRLDGSERLRRRPIRELAHAMSGLGARLRPAPGGGLPLEAGGAPPRGGRGRLSARRSSPFASALMLIGSRLRGGLDLAMPPPAVSLPYVELTARVLGEFGVEVRRTSELSWRIAEGDYRGRDYPVEGDHSSASYFLAAAAVVGGRVRVEGLDAGSAQPDARLTRILDRLGCGVRSGPGFVEVEGSGRVPPFDLDLSDAPDLVPTLAVLGLFSEGPTRMRGIGHLRFKESDRLALLARNLARMGREATASGDSLSLSAPAELRGAVVETAADHRIAMAFAVAGLRLEGVTIDDARCVSKSNPTFWTDFAELEGSGPAGQN